jgi:hypothetical protein
MPFKSKAQMRWMFANHPEMAKRWADHTKDMKALPEKKENDKEKEASLSAELLDKAAALLSNRISGKPSVPLPSAINPNRPTLGIKPVQQNPLTGNSPQYGANSQQAVQQKAQQLGQPQQPQKMAFLRKLAETPPNYLKNIQEAFAEKPQTPTAPTPPPQPTPEPTFLRARIKAQPPQPQPVQDPFSLRQLPGYVSAEGKIRQGVTSGQDNLSRHGVNQRLVNPDSVSIPDLNRFNAIAPVADINDRQVLSNPNKPLSAEMMYDVMNRDASRFNEFAQEQAYEGAPFSWVEALNSKEQTPQKQLAQAYFDNRVKATLDTDARQRQFQNINAQQAAAEQYSRDINATAKRWTGLDEATLNRLSGTIPEELRLRARSGDTSALKEIQKLEQHYANRGALGYAGDIAGTGWDMLNSNAGMLIGAGAGAGLRAAGRAGTAALTRNMATRANLLNNPATRTWSNLGNRAVAATAQGAAKAPAAVGELAGGLAQGIGTFNTQVGLGREALTPIVGEDAASHIANIAATGYYGGRGLIYEPAKAFMSGGLAGLASSAPNMIGSGLPTFMGGKEIYKNRDVIAAELNPYSTQKDIEQAYFDRQKALSPAPIQDALLRANDVSPENVIDGNAPISVDSFKAVENQFPAHMAAINADRIVGSDPQVAGFSEQLAKLNSIADPVARNATRMQLNGQVTQQLGVSLDELEAYNQTSKGLNEANQQIAAKFQAMTQQQAALPPGKPLTKEQQDIRANNEKAYMESLQNYEAVSKQATEKVVPFLTKYQDNQYRKVIAPMEQELPAVAQAAQKAISDRMKGINTPEGEQAIAKARSMQETANRHSYNSAMLALMKSGKITKADLDLKLSKDPAAAKQLIDDLFKGKQVDMAANQGAYKIDPNSLQPVPAQDVRDNSAADVLNAESRRNIAASLNNQSNGALENNPGMWSKLTNEVWGNMQPWEKALTLGGLSLGAIGLFSSLAGGDEDEEDGEEDSGGSFLPLLGLAAGTAAMATPVARYFGYGDALGLGNNQQGDSNVRGSQS